MKFQIVLSNHSPGSIDKLEDVASCLWRGLQEAGHVAGISVGQLDPSAINIFFEYFPDKTLPVFQKMTDLGIRFGVVCTEAITGNTMNNFDRDDDMIVESEGFNWKKRLANFRVVAGIADFVWCVEPNSVEQARAFTKARQAIFLQIGYVAGLRETSPRAVADKDIDVLFYGALNPYRAGILDRLRGAGLTVEAPDFFVPTFARTSLIERSKICLSLNKRQDWPIPSVSRVGYLINNGAVAVWENPPFETGHEPFSITARGDAIVDTCVKIIGSYDPDLGEKNARAFEKALPMSGIMRQAVRETCDFPT